MLRASPAMSRLNILLFGATGYTGRATIPALVKLTKKDGRNLSWGIAGRSREKLNKVLKDTGIKLGVNLAEIPIIVADINNEKSLNEMAARAQLLINVCGPFRFYGEAVVKACIANGTHHLDISGEPQFIETMQLKYKQEAALNNCYIVSSCGFDSIPADLGVVYLQQNFPGVIDSVEAHLQTSTEGGKRKGTVFNYATWESAVYGIHDYPTLKNIRRQLNEQRSKVPPKRQIEKKNKIFMNQLTGQWSLPFPGADTSVVKRSQQYFHENEDKHPVNFDMYFGVDSVSSIIGSIFVYMTLSTLAASEFGKNLLLKHPRLFSLGVFGHSAPIPEEMEKSKASIYLKGTGWLDCKYRNKNEKPNNTPKDLIFGRVAAKDPAYGNTGTIVTLAAITLLEENDKLPNNGHGGVFTPAAAFAKTTLIKRLNLHGITFKIISKL